MPVVLVYGLAHVVFPIYIAITAALQAIVNEDNEVDWDAFVEAEKETIFNSYDDTHLNIFKGKWKRRYRQVASNLNFLLKNNSGDTNNWQTLIANELKAKRKTPSPSSTTTTTTTGSAKKKHKIRS